MGNIEDDVQQELQDIGVPESPATWENVAVGKAEKLLGEVIGDEELAERGAQQEEVAHEVRQEYRREHPSWSGQHAARLLPLMR